MEEACLNKGEKFTKVQQKLELLAQSKLQNLNQNTLKKVEDRLMCLEKGVSEQIASNQKIVRQYRLLFRKYQQQWLDMESRCNQTSFDRSKKIAELKELMAQYFQREDTECKQIYKQAPAIFQQKIQRTSKQLSEQIHQRKEQINGLDDRVSEVVLTCRQNVRKQFEAMDKKADRKFQELTQNCEFLRQSINQNTQTRRKAQTTIMQSLRQTIGEIKQILSSQRVERQKNRDKLCTLLNNAKETIVVR